MHIKLLKPVVVDASHIAVGDVAEVDDITGMYLIRRGLAEQVEAPEDAAPAEDAPKRKRSRRK